MSSSSTTPREQWEALIVEPSVWYRVREQAVDGSSKVAFDAEDMENIDGELQNDFRRNGGFDMTVRRMVSMDHPLARFFRLMYTDEFEEFRGSVLRKTGVSGVAEISKGVREMLIDQIFRYFVFVEDNTTSAIRFGQLIVAVAVFRNNYDDDSKKFIENGVIKSRRRIYKSVTGLYQQRFATAEKELDETKYVIMDEYEIPAEYSQAISQAIIKSINEKSSLENGILPLDYYGSFKTDELSLTNPLIVNTSVFNPVRKLVLHAMHLIAKFVISMDKPVDIVYFGNADPKALLSLREILPTANFTFSQGIDSIDINKQTIVILDKENNREASASIGDDNEMMQQILLVKGLKNTFRSKPENLLAVSMYVRVPSVISGNGTFNFLPGEIYQTAWKNPQDERMRLVWNNTLETNLIEYDVKKFVSARKFQDYIARNLFRFEKIDGVRNEANGLITEEFDSELERMIVKMYSEKFPSGRKSWIELADMSPEMNIIVSPRMIGSESYAFNKLFLYRYHKEIVNIHIDTPSNPLLQHAARVLRGGFFPTANLAKTPLTESIEIIFGSNQEEAQRTLETFNKVVEDRKNVIFMMKEKDIFPREGDKTSMVNLIKDLAPNNFRKIIDFEPSLSQRQDNYMYSLISGIEREDQVIVIQLGDSFGNLMSDVHEELLRNRININTLFFEGTFPFNQIWKNVSRDSLNIVRVDNVYEDLTGKMNDLRSPQLPIIVVRGFGYRDDVYQAFMTSMMKNKVYRGSIEMEDGRIVSIPNKRLVSPAEKFDKILSGKLLGGIRNTSGKSCLMIGTELFSDISFLSKQEFSRVFHLVGSGVGGRKVVEMTTTGSGSLRKTPYKVFVREDMTENFILPVEGDRYDIILCHPIVFTRLVKDSNSSMKFFTEITKAMRQGSTFQTVDLSELISHSEDEGSLLDYSKLLVTNFFTIEILNKTFTLNGHQGFKVRPSELDISKTQLRYDFIESFNDFSEYRRGGAGRGGDDYDDDDFRERDSGYRSDEGGRVSPRMGRRGGEGKRSMTVSSIGRLLTTVEFSLRRAARRSEEEDEAFTSYEGQAVDVGAKVRAYNNLVKRQLINEVDKKVRILDLACGHGQDINKWFVDESIQLYLGIDASDKAIEEGERRFKARRGFKPRNTKFLARDLFGSQEWVFDSQTTLRGKNLFDVTSCQLAIHYAFNDEKTIKRFMYNVSSLTELGGEFIVTTLDDSVIKALVEKEVGKKRLTAKEIVLKGEHYVIKMKKDMVEQLMKPEMVLPGVAYEFTQFPSDAMSRSTIEYIVDKKYFTLLAKEMGFELVSSTNFLELENSPEVDLSKEREQLTVEDLEVARFYRTYRFKKVSEPRSSQASLPEAFKYSDSKQQFVRATEFLGFSSAEFLPKSFARGLFLSPELCFPTPHVKEGSYEAAHILVEDINNLRPTAKQLQLKNRLTNKERIFISKLPEPGNPYELIFLPYSKSSNPERMIDKLADKGSMFGLFVSQENIDKILPGTDSEFANYIFELQIDRRKKSFSINNTLENESFPIIDIEEIRRFASERNLTIEVFPSLNLEADKELNLNQKQFLGLFGMYKLTKASPLTTVEPVAPAVVKPTTKVTPTPRKRSATTKVIKETEEEKEEKGFEPNPEEEMVQPIEGVEDVDRFVLLPGLVQKKAPGKGKDESLNSKAPKGLYKDLANDPRWRFKLSDDWETEEFLIRMPTGETFTSVRNAMIYFKCLFAEEEDEGYKGLNRSSGVPQPQDLKPFTKAIRGKKGTQWKEEEPNILRQVYEAKFTNTPNVSNDDPENLSPLRALLLTKSAQLYSNSKTRNELLESIRSVLQRIFVS